MHNKIILRPAEPEDSQRILSWRNDPRTRAFSINTNVGPPETHKIWFSRMLASNPNRIFIAEEKSIPVGSVRRDFNQDGIYLSWMVNPEFRGRGLGEAMLNLFTLSYPENYKALIKEDNVASVHIAKKCGFVPSGKQQGLLLFTRLQ